MTNSQPPLPQPELNPAGITFDQYEEFTPAKLELVDGILGYGGQDLTGFQLSVLRNMGLLKAVERTDVTVWIDALDRHLQEKLVANSEREAAAMREQLNQAMKDLRIIAQYLSK